MVPRSLANLVEAQLGVSVVASQLAGGGISRNVNWRAVLSDGRAVVIKLCREQRGDALAQLIRAVNAAADGGAPTPRVLAHSLDADMMCLPWVDGVVAGDDAIGSDCDAAAVMRALAALHAVPIAPWMTRIDAGGCSSLYALGDAAARWASAAAASPIHAAFGAFVASRLTALPSPRDMSLPRDGHRLALLHCDIFPDNVILDADGRATLIDMEETAVGWRALDIGGALIGCAFAPLSCDAHWDALGDDANAPLGDALRALWTPQIPRMAAMVRAYDAASPLSEIERATVPDMARIAALALAAWRFIAFTDTANVTTDERQRRRYLEMVARCRFIEQLKWSDILSLPPLTS